MSANPCRDCDARGSRVPDAYFAALAIESGCEWITTDRDCSRFRGLRWRHPLQ
jgi:predicted nucleic acid-binding protein